MGKIDWFWVKCFVYLIFFKFVVYLIFIIFSKWLLNCIHLTINYRIGSSILFTLVLGLFNHMKFYINFFEFNLLIRLLGCFRGYMYIVLQHSHCYGIYINNHLNYRCWRFYRFFMIYCFNFYFNFNFYNQISFLIYFAFVLLYRIHIKYERSRGSWFISFCLQKIFLEYNRLCCFLIDFPLFYLFSAEIYIYFLKILGFPRFNYTNLNIFDSKRFLLYVY